MHSSDSLEPCDYCERATPFWDLDRLFLDLQDSRPCNRPVTPTERQHICALLLGNGPSEVAKQCHKSENGVRGAFSDLYRGVEVLLEKAKGAVKAKNFAEQLKHYRQPVTTSKPFPPLPSPQLPEGRMAIADPLYVERADIESRAYAPLTQPGSLIRIKAPRQMGKSSLLIRLLHQAEQQQHQTVLLNLSMVDQARFTDLDAFLQCFCAMVARGLKLDHQLAERWDNEFLGSMGACNSYFEDYLLPAVDTPLTLGLDELDLIFDYPCLARDFLGLLRAWHEAARTERIWRNLQLVLVHSTAVYVPLEANQSPFNVGLPLELTDFTAVQVLDLARRQGLTWFGLAEVEQLMALIGGHPSLTQLALYHLALGTLTLGELVQTAATQAGIYGNHLSRHLGTLNDHPELAAAMATVVQASAPVRLETEVAFKLCGLGLTQLVENDVVPRYEIYRQYFREHLG